MCSFSSSNPLSIIHVSDEWGKKEVFQLATDSSPLASRGPVDAVDAEIGRCVFVMNLHEFAIVDDMFALWVVVDRALGLWWIAPLGRGLPELDFPGGRQKYGNFSESRDSIIRQDLSTTNPGIPKNSYIFQVLVGMLSGGLG